MVDSDDVVEELVAEVSRLRRVVADAKRAARVGSVPLSSSSVSPSDVALARVVTVLDQV